MTEIKEQFKKRRIGKAPSEAFEVSAAQRKEFHRRCAAHQADQTSGIPWRQVRARLLQGGG